jgi:hypothetical protein
MTHVYPGILYDLVQRYELTMQYGATFLETPEERTDGGKGIVERRSLQNVNIGIGIVLSSLL